MEAKMEDEINLLDYWRVIRKRWRIIALIFGISVIIAVIMSLFMTPIYQATTTIMPIESSGGGLSTALQSIQGLDSIPFFGGMVSGFGGASTDKLIAVLKSRTLAEDVIHSLDLMNVLFTDGSQRPPTLQTFVKSFVGIIEITDDRKGLINISVNYNDADMAADVANQYTASLQKFINENALSMAKRNRIFIEGQLDKVKVELKEAEEAMKSFQTDKKIIAIDAQTESAIKAIAELNAQITAREVQLGVIKQFSTSANPDVLRIKDELRELKKQLAMIESKGDTPQTGIFPSLSEAPTLGLQYIRLKRKALIQEKVFELLTQQYEIAKIDEAKEDVTFQIIDRAIPPENRIKPNRRLNVMLAGAVSIFVGIFFVFLIDYIATLKETKEKSEREGI
ncbi:MAG: Wzz/FepE/Etk N-terminal domain-containing protein [Thermodesulfobacteriota bacterium]|nr:Wzz/FepE/Etk N-terminal domain-containing protein [Thermodesulfobacteriota bacterium]